MELIRLEVGAERKGVGMFVSYKKVVGLRVMQRFI